jgi:hypothetical protein
MRRAHEGSGAKKYRNRRPSARDQPNDGTLPENASHSVSGARRRRAHNSADTAGYQFLPTSHSIRAYLAVLYRL